MSNSSEYKSLKEWKKAKPNDYVIAKRKNYIGFICEYYGWIEPKSLSDKKIILSINSYINDFFENETNNLLSSIEEEMNNFYDRGNISAGRRLRKHLKSLNLKLNDFNVKLKNNYF